MACQTQPAGSSGNVPRAKYRARRTPHATRYSPLAPFHSPLAPPPSHIKHQTHPASPALHLTTTRHPATRVLCRLGLPGWAGGGSSIGPVGCLDDG